MKSECPFCNYKNDTHRNRKNRFKFSDLGGFHIPFISKDFADFKLMVCGKCGKKYKDKKISPFSIPSKYGWVLPVVVLFLFICMLYVGQTHGN